MQKSLDAIISTLNRYHAVGKLEGKKNAQIADIQFNSSFVEKNSLFCALRGIHTDGHAYIEDAIKRGASAILCDIDYCPDDALLEKAAFFRVEKELTRKIMAEISAIFYDYPAERIKIIGVTGTDGKSTTVSFIHQLLSMQGIRAGFLSTIEFYDGKKYSSNRLRQSTPESPQIHQALSQMIKNKCKVAILEATSHGLSEETARLFGIEFDIAILTNITSEHLDFHKTVQNYAEAKSNLFKQTKPNGIGIINKNDKYKELFSEQLKIHGAQLRTYSTEEQASYYVQDIKNNIQNIQGTLVHAKTRIDAQREVPFTLNCVGLHNVNNLLAAIAGVDSLEMPISFSELCNSISKLKSPPGRMQIISPNLSILPIVDYAHTPGSYEKILPMIKSITKSKLIMVFGSAGERDVEKRKVQGAIADKYADIIVLTNEDPRGEEPMTIIENISAGCQNHELNKNLFHIPNREEAIEKALMLAEKDDTILFLGKGHEKSIELNNETLDWNETEIVQSKIKKLKNTKKWKK